MLRGTPVFFLATFWLKFSQDRREAAKQFSNIFQSKQPPKAAENFQSRYTFVVKIAAVGGGKIQPRFSAKIAADGGEKK